VWQFAIQLQINDSNYPFSMPSNIHTLHIYTFLGSKFNQRDNSMCSHKIQEVQQEILQVFCTQFCNAKPNNCVQLIKISSVFANSMIMSH